MMQALEASAADKVKELGIEIIDVRIKSINLQNDNVSGSVYERMRAERSRIAADYRAALEAGRSAQGRPRPGYHCHAYRDAEKLRGEGVWLPTSA